MKKVKSKNKGKSSKESVKSVPHKEEAHSIGEFETEDDDYRFIALNNPKNILIFSKETFCLINIAQKSNKSIMLGRLKRFLKKMANNAVI